MTRSNLFDIRVIYQTQTAKAVCIRRDEADAEDIWIPLYACEFETADGRDPRRGDVVTLTAPQLTLESKGLV